MHWRDLSSSHIFPPWRSHSQIILRVSLSLSLRRIHSIRPPSSSVIQKAAGELWVTPNSHLKFSCSFIINRRHISWHVVLLDVCAIVWKIGLHRLTHIWKERSIAGTLSIYPPVPAPSRGLRFSNFMLIKQHTLNVCLLFVVHYFHFWGLRYTADSAGWLHGPRDAQLEGNISGPWALLTHCGGVGGPRNKKLWHLEWPTVQGFSLKRMLKWIFWHWTNACKRNPICHSFTLNRVENWDTPRRRAILDLLPHHPPTFPSHSLTCSCVCVIGSDKQGWGANASAAAALTPTRGPLERRPNWQVVITSGFQLHLPSAPLGSATSHQD